METTPLTHVPVVAAPAYAESVQHLPSTFTATLRAEPDNRFNRTAVAVIASGEKVGYLPPELARHYCDAATGAGAECPGRRAPMSARENTGVELLLDLSGVARVD